MQTKRQVLITRTAATATLAVALMFAVDMASATPYFARQTGLDCLQCHRNAPTGRDAANDLTSDGRKFKNSGYDPGMFSSPEPQRRPRRPVESNDNSDDRQCHKEFVNGRTVNVCN
jgi:hypothetical protein